MSDISKYLEIYTQKYLLDLALSQVDDELDKRQGSIIYDTLAVVCAKLADTFVEIKQIVDQGYMRTATKDENIEYRAEERGIWRYKATTAKRLGVFTNPDGTPATVPIGSLFSTIDETRENIINFVVTEPYNTQGSYILECETFGTVGNTYFGEILPLTPMDTLGSATISTVLQPARDEESNESLKERYYATFNIEAFGGNIADYKRILQQFSGIGQRQIYPKTRVDENIVISCIDPSNQPISTEYQNTIKQELDPENYYNNGNDTSGMGLGMVPIGHKVTVTAPQQAIIDIDLTIILSNTSHFETVRQNIERNITAYIKQVQDSWDNGEGEYDSVVYYNQIVTAVNSTSGVVNLATCFINGGTSDIVLEQNREQQYIPVLGTLTVSEV